MKIMIPALACLLLAACDNGSTTPDAAVDSSVSKDTSLDAKTASPDKTVSAPDKTVAAPDKAITTPDKKVSAPDKTITAPDKTVTPPDKAVTPPDKAAPPAKLLAAKLTKLSCWCNKMPPGTSNIVMVEATLSNGSKTPVSGVKAIKSSFSVVPSGLPVTITLKADPPFTGTVPGGGTASVKLRAQGTPVQVPIPCNGTIKVTTSFTSALGAIGPYTTAQATCMTVY